MKNKLSIRLYSKRRSYIALIGNLIMISFIIAGLTLQLTNTNSYIGYYGIDLFKMFTLDSNLLVCACSILSIPYQIDGIRTGNYHLPRWIVTVLYVGVSAVAMTFIVALFVLTPFMGFKAIMLNRSNFLFHLVNPILSIILFIFINCDHNIKFKYVIISNTPVFLYAVIYLIMVFIIGEDNGGWKDHYQFNTYIPWPVTAVIMLAASFGVSVLLRLTHNIMHKHQKNKIKEIYYNSYEFNLDNIEDSIKYIAKMDKIIDPLDNEVIIPRRLLYKLKEKYNSNKSIKDICLIYLEEYLNK